MSEFPGAREKFVDESRVWIDQNDHAAIVLHGTGGNPEQTADQLGDFFETTPAKTSVHYGIDRQGNIDQYVWEKDGAGGNGILDTGHDPFWDHYADNPNWHSLSVETENDLNNSLLLTDPQKRTMFKLVKFWVDKYHIPLSNIKGHFSLEPVERKNCPGPNFPWAELLAFLQGGQPMTTIPIGWTDDGTTLTAPNGIPLVRGFRDHVLNSNWDASNWPLEAEHAASPVEESNTTLGAGTAQTFRMTRMAYTASRGVYVSWIGQEVLWYRTQLPTLQGEIAKLQALPIVDNLNKIQIIGHTIKDDVDAIMKLAQVQ